MIQRCRNPKHPQFWRYGGAGIGVSDDWLDFGRFLTDMGERPPARTLDRIDNNAGYSVANCRWATRKEQQRNTSMNRRFLYEGEMRCIAEISEMCAISYDNLQYRLSAGWPVELATTSPPSRRPHERRPGATPVELSSCSGCRPGR